MNTMIRSVLVLSLSLFCAFGTANATDITSAAHGAWNLSATWQGGVVPTATDNVSIRLEDSVTVDIINATCNNLTINGACFFTNTGAAAGLTVNGNLVVNTGARLKLKSLDPASPTFVTHALTIYGNLTNNGVLDFRQGSNGSTANGVTTSFLGSSNSEIRLVSSTYQNSVEEFNSVTVNKTGGAKVVLASGNLFMSNNTSTGPAILTLTSGIIETGTNVFTVLATSNGAVVGASATNYVLGNLGRGMSNSAGATRDFAIGDAAGYRPLNLRSTTSGGSTGHHVIATVVHGNANSGSSSLAGGIDRVSAIRYFKVKYVQGAGAAQMSFDRVYPSYGSDDGVSAGNTDLRGAYSVDDRATWTGLGQTSRTDTTTLANPPNQIHPDSLSPVLTLQGGTGSILFALGRLTGTTTNDLGVGTSVIEEAGIPQHYFVAQNYPNPFNPSTTIEYGLPRERHVSLMVFNVVGQKVATIVNERQRAGVHRVQFNAANLPSGVYFYRIDAGGTVKASRMLLMK